METVNENDEEEKTDGEKSVKNQKNDVIMNIDPKSIQKKDQIFMDFFSMYGKNYIQSKRTEIALQKQG